MFRVSTLWLAGMNAATPVGAWPASSGVAREITERPHAPSGVAAFVSAHSKTPYITPSMDSPLGKGKYGGAGGSSWDLPSGVEANSDVDALGSALYLGWRGCDFRGAADYCVWFRRGCDFRRAADYCVRFTGNHCFGSKPSSYNCKCNITCSQNSGNGPGKKTPCGTPCPHMAGNHYYQQNQSYIVCG